MSEKEKAEFGNQTFKRNFSKKEDINKIKSGMKRFRRKSTNRRHLDEKNEIRYIPRVNDRNRHIDRKVDGKEKEEKMYVIPLGGIEEVGKKTACRNLTSQFVKVVVPVAFQIVNTPFLFPYLDRKDSRFAVTHTVISAVQQLAYHAPTLCRGIRSIVD